MKGKTIWKNNFQSVVDNGRGHEVNLDLPELHGGQDIGATALEVCVMSFSGCVATIFAMMAQKMKLSYSSLEVDVNAEKSAETGTIGSVDFTVTLSSGAGEEKLQKCLDLTEQNCPVGVLFRNAGVKITHKLLIQQLA